MLPSQDSPKPFSLTLLLGGLLVTFGFLRLVWFFLATPGSSTTPTRTTQHSIQTEVVGKVSTHLGNQVQINFPDLPATIAGDLRTPEFTLLVDLRSPRRPSFFKLQVLQDDEVIAESELMTWKDVSSLDLGTVRVRELQRRNSTSHRRE